MSEFLKFVDLLLGYAPAVGYAPLIAWFVDMGKKHGLIPDGYAHLASGVLNVLIMAALYFAGPEHEAEVRSVLDAVYLAGPAVVGLFAALASTKLSHNALVALGFGYSHNGGGR